MKKAITAIATACISPALMGQGVVFAPQQQVSSPTKPVALAAADMNSDGLVDLIVNAQSGVECLLNNGAMGFTNATVPGTSGSFTIGGVAAADLDGDGDKDLAYSRGSSIWWNANDGNALFSQRQYIGSGSLVADIATADIDGDGDLDVLFVSNSINASDSVAWIENLGFGFWGQEHVIWPSLPDATAVTAADLDNDGDIDVITTSESTDKVDCWYNDGSGFNWINSLAGVLDHPTDVATADFNNDGIVDIVASGRANSTSQTPYVVWWPGMNGGTGYGSPQTISSGSAWRIARGLDVGDLDGDGDLDTVNTSTGNGVSCTLNGGSGNFSGVIGAGHGPAGGLPTASIFADFDGDADLDVAFAAQDADAVFLAENLFTPPVTSTSTVYGSGCGSPPLSFTPTSTAITGQGITATVTNTPTPFCWVGVGTNTVMTASGTPLPLDLGFVGMPGCNLYNSAEVFGLITTGAGVAFQMNFGTWVPNNPALVSQHYYFQAFSIAPGANASEVISSNGIDFLIGNQ